LDGSRGLKLTDDQPAYTWIKGKLGRVDTLHPMFPTVTSSPSGNLPDLTAWLEDAVLAMPAEGRFGIKVPSDLAFGFTDDRATEKGNQDRLAVAYCIDAGQQGGRWFFAGVCDGVGGEARGNEAASIALAHVISSLSSASGPLNTRFTGSIRRAHDEVQRRFHRRSATTFVGILVSDTGDIVVASVGDSRAYALSDTGVEQLTKDDTLAEMLRRQPAGASDEKIREAIKALQPQFQESLGQALGSDLPMTPNLISLRKSGTRDGVLLCSDGVWKCVDQVLSDVVMTSVGRRDLARRLLSLTDTLGAKDNSTAIVIPDLGKVVDWLREAGRPSERGLLHVLLPVESVVAPIQMFRAPGGASATPHPVTTSSPTPVPTPVPIGEKTSRESYVAKTESAKNKRKNKSAKGTKKSGTTEPPVIQMTIVEGPRDAETQPPGKVPEEKG
jgi:serine/threonine protein phosphatase PrpC